MNQFYDSCSLDVANCFDVFTLIAFPYIGGMHLWVLEK